MPLLVLALDRPPMLERSYFRVLLARRELADGPPSSSATIAHLRGRFEGTAIAYAAAIGFPPDEIERAPVMFDELWAELEPEARAALERFEQEERQLADRLAT